MLLQSLIELVETLRERIDTRGNTLSELQTRYELIDPLLRELGWDTSDPEQVVVEYSLDKKRADYALHKNGSPVMIVEAKAASVSLEDAPNQAFDYSRRGIGARYFAVTNGVRWEVYDTRQPAQEMMIVSFDLKEQSPAEVCLKALALWRPSVESGYVAAGAGPILEEPLSGTEKHPPPPEPGWKPLSELDPKTMPDTDPKGIRFPDGSVVPVQSFISVVRELLKWMRNNGKIESVRPSWEQYAGREHILARVKSIIVKHARMNLAEFQLRFD